MAGRPPKEYNKKSFEDLVGLGCKQDEICWFFRDERGKVANVDTLSRWCKRTYGVDFQEYYRQNGGMIMKIRLRRNQVNLSEKSAAMAIFLGKQFLGQSDNPVVDQDNIEDDGFLKALSGSAVDDWSEDTE